MPYGYEDHDIYDNGFDENLIRGKDMGIARVFPQNQPQIKQRKVKQEHKATYKNGTLYFLNKEIDFNNKQNQKYLLKILFKKSTYNWPYDEIAADLDWDETGVDGWLGNKPAWKIFYSAGNGINTAIAKKTQIEDFIIKNTKEIRINPKYM